MMYERLVRGLYCDSRYVLNVKPMPCGGAVYTGVVCHCTGQILLKNFYYLLVSSLRNFALRGIILQNIDINKCNAVANNEIVFFLGRTVVWIA